MADGTRYSFSLDGLIDLAKMGFELLLSLFRPMLGFMTTVSGSGWIGFAVIFMIFFMIFLIRTGARAGKVGAYADGLEYIGLRGLQLSTLYLLLLCAEFLLMPLLVIVSSALLNGLIGMEPDMEKAFHFLTTPSHALTGFIVDMIGFYNTDRLWLPLGFRPTGLVMVAFGAMYAVAQAFSRQRSAPES